MTTHSQNTRRVRLLEPEASPRQQASDSQTRLRPSLHLTEKGERVRAASCPSPRPYQRRVGFDVCIEVKVRERRLCLEGFVARMGDNRLRNKTLLGELARGATYSGQQAFD
ncbi:unnamed protein product [Pylaiella littoralis]